MSENIKKIKFNTTIYYGENSRFNLSQVLDEYGFKNPLIIYDTSINLKNLKIDKLLRRFKSKNFFKISLNFEPTYQYLDFVRKEIRKRNFFFDSILAIGGGSTMDIGKSLAVVYNSKKNSIKFKGIHKTISNKVLNVGCIPSTIGTGSEVTYKASLINEIDNVKFGINYINNYPMFAILDPEIIKSGPLKIIINSGLDALVHCLESHASIISTEETKILSKFAFSKITNGLSNILNGSKKNKDILDCQIGAVFAMIAMSNTSPGPMTALSYFIGTRYKIPHGIASGILIKVFVKLNLKNGYFYDGIDKNEKLFKRKINKIIQNKRIKKLSKYYFSLVLSDELKLFLQSNDICRFNPIKIKQKHIIDIINAR